VGEVAACHIIEFAIRELADVASVSLVNLSIRCAVSSLVWSRGALTTNPARNQGGWPVVAGAAVKVPLHCWKVATVSVRTSTD
jgi:hypothetical protein